MPCGMGEEEVVYREDRAAKKKIKYLEACLCAVLTELADQGIVDEVITNASKRGKVDLMKFWLEHNIADAKRLQKELDKFSEHERMMLKKLLSKEN